MSKLRARIYPCAVVSATPGPAVTVNPDGSTTTVTGNPITCAAAPTATAPTSAGAFNDSRTGGGAGASFRVPLFNKKLDFGAKGVYRDGIAPFGSPPLAVAPAPPDRTLAPTPTRHILLL